MAAPRSSARFVARMIKGARSGEMPGFIEPALATGRDEAPVGEKWVHEVKYDGWRVQAYLNGGEVTSSFLEKIARTAKRYVCQQRPL